MEISFCVPTYCRAEYLKRCLASVLSQADLDIEVIVQDNCSPDHTWEVVAGLTDPRLRYYRNPANIGGVLNITSIIEKAQGRYIYFLTDDAYLAVGGIAKLKAFICQNNPVFFTSHVRQYLEQQQFYYDYNFFVHSIDAATPPDPATIARIIYSARFIPRVCFKRSKLDYPLLRKYGDNWYPHLLIAFQMASQGPLMYLADPVIRVNVENQGYGFPEDMDDTERGLFKIVKLMRDQVDYELLEAFIFLFCRMRTEISDDLLELLTPESRATLKTEAKAHHYRVVATA